MSKFSVWRGATELLFDAGQDIREPKVKRGSVAREIEDSEGGLVDEGEEEE